MLEEESGRSDLMQSTKLVVRPYSRSQGSLCFVHYATEDPGNEATLDN